MKKKTIILIGAAILVLALLLGGLPLVSQLVFHRSLAATMLTWQFRRDRYTTAEAFEEYLDEKRAGNAASYVIPEDAALTVPVVRDTYGEMDYFVLNGPGGPDGRIILYFPGGSYIDQPTRSHWEFMNALAEDTGSVIYVPLYPKLPDRDAASAYAVLTDWYASLLRGTVHGEVLFMGDSAGGGMALSLAMQLRDTGLGGPDRLILLSPWADVTMTNTAIPGYGKRDPALDAEMLRQLGILWAGGLDTTDPVVSPLYGDLTGLGEIIFFTTDGELLYPDLVQLADELEAAGAAYRMYPRSDLFHCWPLYAYLNIPESEEDYARIVSIINEGQETP